MAATLTVARFGPGVTVINAFLFIGLDLTSRDRLHDAWHGNGLVWKMGLLIVAGSLLSYLINQNSARIAIASLVSFAVAAGVDSLVYSLLYHHKYTVKVNGSNVVSALVDSLIFPTLAFGAFLPLIVLGQFVAKVLGGAVWAWILGRKAQAAPE